MLLYHTDSWHYRLVLYVFSKDFFMETDGIDLEAMKSQWDSRPPNTDDIEIIYKKKPRTVNFCPYCRAVGAAAFSLPFVFLWRLYPHKPKPKETHAQIMKRMRRNSWIARIIGACINVPLGIKNIVIPPDPEAYGGHDLAIVIGIAQITVGLGILNWPLVGRKSCTMADTARPEKKSQSKDKAKEKETKGKEAVKACKKDS